MSLCIRDPTTSAPPETQEDGLPIGSSEYGRILAVLSKEQQWQGCIRVLRWMRDGGVEPSAVTYADIISCLADAGKWDAAMSELRTAMVSMQGRQQVASCPEPLPPPLPGLLVSIFVPLFVHLFVPLLPPYPYSFLLRAAKFSMDEHFFLGHPCRSQHPDVGTMSCCNRKPTSSTIGSLPAPGGQGSSTAPLRCRG